MKLLIAQTIAALARALAEEGPTRHLREAETLMAQITSPPRQQLTPEAQAVEAKFRAFLGTYVDTRATQAIEDALEHNKGWPVFVEFFETLANGCSLTAALHATVSGRGTYDNRVVHRALWLAEPELQQFYEDPIQH